MIYNIYLPLNGMKNIKLELFTALHDFVHQRIEHIQLALSLANEAGKDETKSSAGDKHETGRAMAHLDQEQQQVQLAAALILRDQLERINPMLVSLQVTLGSLINTNKGWFYISIGAGRIEVQDFFCMAISPQSPLAKAFLGTSIGTKVALNGNQYEVLAIL